MASKGARGQAVPVLSVVIVTYNSSATLPGLAASLPAGMLGVQYEIIVVDNDSADDSAELAANLWPDATVVRAGRNAGYAAGINTGAAHAAPGRHLLVLNPDIQLAPGAARLLADALTPGDVALAVPQLLEADGRTAFSLRRDPSLRSEWVTALLGGRVADRLGLAEMVTEPAFYSRPHDVEWATGAVVLVAAAWRETLGAWDESFFLYSEEVEFCQRARAKGLRVRYCPDAQARHARGASGRSESLVRLLADNRAILYGRSHGRPAQLAFRAATITGRLLRQVVPSRVRARARQPLAVARD